MPIYEYECEACGPFAHGRPMAESTLPSACPTCAASAPRVLSATAIASGRGGSARRRDRTEPALVTVKERREPAKKRPVDPLKVKAGRHGPDRPWMVGH